MTEDLQISIANGVQTIRLTRAAKKNALTSAMYEAMTEALISGDANPAVTAHVFLGSGGVFSAGNDIQDFLESTRAGSGTIPPAVRFVRNLPVVAKPMIAGVDGLAVGVGTTLLLHCDLVYTTPSAVLLTPFLDLGLVPEAGSSLIAPQRMGYVRAFELLVLGNPLTAERAREAGLINEVLPSSDLEVAVMKAARRLAEKPPEALMIARRLMRGDTSEIVKRIDEEMVEFRQRLGSPEAREAFEAFLEKRPPNFKKPRPGG